MELAGDELVGEIEREREREAALGLTRVTLREREGTKVESFASDETNQLFIFDQGCQRFLIFEFTLS